MKPVPIFNAKGLKKFRYMDRPGGPVREITLQEFEQKFCKYTEDLLGDPAMAEAYRKERAKRPPTEEEQKILNRMENPPDLIICYVNEEIGHIIIAGEDFEELGFILACYGGVIKSASDATFDEQDYGVSLVGRDSKEITLVTAADVGGIARFFPDLPYDYGVSDQAFFNEMRKTFPLEKFPQATDQFIRDHIPQRVPNSDLIEDIKFHSQKTRENIACVNALKEVTSLFGVPLVLIKVNNPIKKGDVIGYIYDEKYGYWKGKQKLPRLLTREGQAVKKSDYHFLPEGKIYQTITDCSHADEKGKAAMAMQIYEQGTIAFKAGDYKHAEGHVLKALNIFRKLNACSQEMLKCLSTLMSCHRELGNLEKAFDFFEVAMSTPDIKESQKESLKVKVKTCLPSFSAESLHTRGVKCYGEMCYELAALELNFAIEKFKAVKELAPQVDSLSVLASCYRKMGRTEQAIKTIQEALDLAIDVFGKDHSNTKKILGKKEQMPTSSLRVSVQAAISSSSSSLSAPPSLKESNVGVSSSPVQKR